MSYFRVRNIYLFIFIYILICLKIGIYILLTNNIISINLGGGNDADYYDQYALGYIDVVTSIWPVILRFLNENNFYSRELISYFFLFLNLFIIPVLVNNLSGLNFKKDQKYYLYGILLCLIYPTLFFYTFDIYRDVFMVFSFLVGCLIVKKCLSRSNFISFSYFYILAILIGLFLMALRPYLGYAFLLALFFWKIKLTKKCIYFFSFLYLIVLFIANYIGVFEGLTEYRSGFEDGDGGSTLGLDFSNPVMFIPNFILNIFGQLFGLYITNPLAIALFFIETVPFIFMFFYILKNIKYADSFMQFLIVFFVLYASVWLIGNDNLGTAVRLRMYNYLVVYICFFYILIVKEKIKYQQVVNQ